MNELIIASILSFIILGYLIYKVIILQKQIVQFDKEHRKLIADAGLALTETIKVAFDNIKQINQKHERLSTIVKDNKEKIQNIMVGSRSNNRNTKIDKINRLRAAIDAAKKNQEPFNELENENNE